MTLGQVSGMVLGAVCNYGANWIVNRIAKLTADGPTYCDYSLALRRRLLGQMPRPSNPRANTL